MVKRNISLAIDTKDVKEYVPGEPERMKRRKNGKEKKYVFKGFFREGDPLFDRRGVEKQSSQSESGSSPLDKVVLPRGVRFDEIGTSDSKSTCIAWKCSGCNGRGWYPVRVSHRIEKKDNDWSTEQDTFYRYAACDDFSMNSHRRCLRKGVKPENVVSCCCGVPGHRPEVIRRKILKEMLELTSTLVPSVAQRLDRLVRQLDSPHLCTSE